MYYPEQNNERPPYTPMPPLPEVRPLPRVRGLTTYLKIGCGVALVLTLVGAVVGALLGLPIMFVALLALALVMVLLPALGFAWLAERSTQWAIVTILTDQRTAYWTYSEQEWRRFTTLAWRQANLYILLWLGIFLGGTLIIDLALAKAYRDSIAVFMWEAVFIAAYYLLAFLQQTRTLLRRRRKPTGEVFIHRVGIIRDGWYTSLGGLRGITYQAGDPPALRFHTGWGRGARTHEVPVPRGREAEAEYLAQRLK